jgi:DNA repair protein RadC
MNSKQRLSINQWAESDRPREKMMSLGAECLSDAELLAILIGSGNTEESAVELMRRVLSQCDNELNNLAKWNLSDFSQFKGLGPAKSVSIMAALELGRRRKERSVKEREKVGCSLDVYNMFLPLMADLPQEEFWILLLNQACLVIDKIRISSGGIDGTYADVRTILREAILKRATQLALIHNHPSGNPHPSKQDTHLTQTVQKAAEIMNIRMFDHVIVSDGKYYSFADDGAL